MWNLWTAIFGSKKGAQVAAVADPVLSAVAPQAEAVVQTVDNVADSVPAGSTTAQAAVTIATELDPALATKLRAAETAILSAVNAKLETAGADKVTEEELDALITAQFASVGVTKGGAA
jgi:hypothetical protein